MKDDHPLSKVIEVPLIINGVRFHISHPDIRIIDCTLYPKYQLLFILTRIGSQFISSYTFEKDSIKEYIEILNKLVNNHKYDLQKELKEVEKYLPFE
jgi:hypothetical protein